MALGLVWTIIFHSATDAQTVSALPVAHAVTQLQTSVDEQIACSLHECTVLCFLIVHDKIPLFLPTQMFTCAHLQPVSF